MTIGLSNFVPLSYDSTKSRQSATNLLSLRDQMTDLQRQLATGKLSDSYAGLGPNAAKSLDLRKTLSRYDDFGAAITDGSTRLKLMDAAVAGVAKEQQTVKSGLVGSNMKTLQSNGQSLAQQTAQTSMKAVIGMLNTDAAGRYLFSGRATDTEPVLDYDTIINGTPTAAGLKQIITERKAADNPDGKGLVTVDSTTTAGTVVVSNATSPLGITIGAPSSQTAAITVSTAGTPPAASFVVATQPADGDVVQLGVTFPDGTTKLLTLTARTGTADPTKGEFQVGADTTATANALGATITSLMQTTAATDLAAASAMKAATDFFSATPASPYVRLSAATPAATVQWYVGDTTSADPRSTALVQVDKNQTVPVGAQANEPAFARFMAQLGVLSVETFSASNVNDSARYDALAQRAAPDLGTGGNGPQRVNDIQVSLGVAQATITTAKSRNTAHAATLKDALAGIEDADSTSVAVQLSDLQTRLQASYSTTAMLSKMSLVNYLG
jgi:flagellin-like hook-associated protein FlgL